MSGAGRQTNRTTSCGCARAAKHKARLTKHGESNKSKEYRSWMHMRQRCYNANVKGYDMYGGRGIKMCDRWFLSYENFLADMGRAPSPSHSIDRYPDNNGNYQPGNCRWATKKEQSNNRRYNVMITINGITKNATEWSNEVNLRADVILKRKRAGWSDHDALFKPRRIRPHIT